MSRAAYEIRVAGEVPTEVLENFESVVLIAETMDTTLRAELTDSAALHGLLTALRQAGLELLEVRRELAMEDPNPLEPDHPST